MALYTWTSSLMTGSGRSSGSIQTVGRRSGANDLLMQNFISVRWSNTSSKPFCKKYSEIRQQNDSRRRFGWFITCLGKSGQYGEHDLAAAFFAIRSWKNKHRHGLPIVCHQASFTADCSLFQEHNTPNSSRKVSTVFCEAAPKCDLDMTYSQANVWATWVGSWICKKGLFYQRFYCQGLRNALLKPSQVSAS